MSRFSHFPQNPIALISPYEGSDEPLHLEIGRYERGGALALTTDEVTTGHAFATLSVNLVGIEPPLADDEVVLKTWDGMEPHLAPVFATGLFEDTGRFAQVGMELAPIWRVRDASLLPTWTRPN